MYAQILSFFDTTKVSQKIISNSLSEGQLFFYFYCIMIFNAINFVQGWLSIAGAKLTPSDLVDIGSYFSFTALGLMALFLINGGSKGKHFISNWGKVKALTEKQVIAAAKSDPDNKPLTRAQLKKFKRVNPPKEKEIDVKHIRMLLHVSQSEFAGYFGVSIRTIQEWEQHRRTPSTIARNFLKVIEKAPKAVLKALAA